MYYLYLNQVGAIDIYYHIFLVVSELFHPHLTLFRSFFFFTFTEVYKKDLHIPDPPPLPSNNSTNVF